MMQCPLCDKSYQYGHQIYEGYYCKLYDIRVCGICWEYNWDGWNPRHEEKLIEILKNKGLPIPERNNKGWFPRE